MSDRPWEWWRDEMSRAIDRTGNKHGLLTVIEREGSTRQGRPLWRCQCECGNQVVVRYDNLSSGRVKSCGCLKSKGRPSAALVVRVNERHGRLVVTERAKNDKKGRTCWLCQCDCGNVVVVRASRLARGAVKSCGCITKSVRGHRVRFGPDGVREDDDSDKAPAGSCLEIPEHIHAGDSLTGFFAVSPAQGVDLTSLVCGSLEVLRRTGANEQGKDEYLCRCICQNEITLSEPSLRKGLVLDCGCSEVEKERRKAWSVNYQGFGNSFNYVYDYYRLNAYRKGIEFGFSERLFFGLICSPCHYCGVVGSKTHDFSSSPLSLTYNGVHRLDESLGYTIGNVAPCCAKCGKDRGIRENDFLTEAEWSEWQNVSRPGQSIDESMAERFADLLEGE